MAQSGWWAPIRVPGRDLKLTSNVARERPEETVLSGGLSDSAINVGEVYTHLVRDVHAGTYNTPGFEHAHHNARVIEAVRRSAERGGGCLYVVLCLPPST